MEQRAAGGGLRMSALALLLVAPLIYLMANVRGAAALFAALFGAQFLLFLNSGPISSAIVSCVPPTFRAFAMGLCVLCIHLLGDALSPTLLGAIADAASYELAIELSALPVLACGALLLAASRLLRAALGAPPGMPPRPGA
jgi:MFS transporter, Spinster family, sphingosine-1-phosphate transporter